MKQISEGLIAIDDKIWVVAMMGWLRLDEGKEKKHCVKEVKELRGQNSTGIAFVNIVAAKINNQSNCGEGDFSCRRGHPCLGNEDCTQSTGGQRQGKERMRDTVGKPGRLMVPFQMNKRKKSWG